MKSKQAGHIPAKSLNIPLLRRLLTPEQGPFESRVRRCVLNNKRPEYKYEHIHTRCTVLPST